MITIKRGQIGLVHSRHFLGRTIQTGMNIRIWRKWLVSWLIYPITRNKPDKIKFWTKIYNHAVIGIGDNNEISEAIKEGIVNWDINKSYPAGCNKDIIIFDLDLNEKQICQLEAFAKKYTGTKYQFVNFLQYVPEVFIGMWFGRTGEASDNRLYCTEYVSKFINQISNGDHFERYWRSCPSDVFEWCKTYAEYVTEYKHL